MEEAFLVFPRIETDRLILDQVTPDDLEQLYRIKSNPDVTNRYCRDPHTSMIQTEGWIKSIHEGYLERKSIFWKITFRENGALAGSITLWNMELESFEAEVGYELHPDSWNRGIMSEAMKAVLDWAFSSFGLNRVEACPMSVNGPSVSLLLRAGFVLEGTLRERIFFKGKFYDQAYYSILKREWQIKSSA